MKFLQPSNSPLADLEKVTYIGQPESRRLYRYGYEHYLGRLPQIEPHDGHIIPKMALTLATLKELGNELLIASWVKENMPLAGDFSRTILAIEKQSVNDGGELQEGAELIVAKWGEGFVSPVHGHKAGLIYEELLLGKLLVNLFRIVDREKRIVRPLRSDIYKDNALLVGTYAKGEGGNRDALVHNFVALEPSTSLHYVPEHTRDGRDNGFTVEYFDTFHPLTPHDVDRITSKDGMYLRKGDVCLVDSSNVPEYGFHYIVVTGHPILKEHGLRVQDVAIAAPTNKLLPSYQQEQGLTLLKLKPDVAKSFREFHGIEIKDGEVVFPEI